MPDRTLHDCHVLIVEDEYMLADELRTELDGVGAVVLGLAGTLRDALTLIGSEQPIDGAILDVNLRGGMVFPAADLLVRRGVAIVFTTGYDASMIPARFARVARCEKPINIGHVAQAIGRVIDPEKGLP